MENEMKELQEFSRKFFKSETTRVDMMVGSSEKKVEMKIKLETETQTFFSLCVPILSSLASGGSGGGGDGKFLKRRREHISQKLLIYARETASRMIINAVERRQRSTIHEGVNSGWKKVHTMNWSFPGREREQK